MHLSEGEIRAYQDRQIEAVDQHRVENHLAGCPQCRASAEAARSQAERVHTRLSGQDSAAPHLNPAAARRKLEARLRQEPETQEKLSMWQKMFGKLPRPAWAGIALVAVLAVALAFPQVRAAADSFLQMFRVEQVRLLPVDMNQLSSEMRSSEQLEALFTENVQVEKKGEPTDVGTFDEAAALAGFPLRRLSGVEGDARYSVEPGATMTFKVDLQWPARRCARSAARISSCPTVWTERWSKSRRLPP